MNIKENVFLRGMKFISLTKEQMKIINRGIINGISSNKIQKELSDKGIGLKRQELLSSIRLEKSNYYITVQKDKKTGEKIRIVDKLKDDAKFNSNLWHKEVLEPFRKQNNMDREKALRIINDGRIQSKTVADARLYNDYEDRYERLKSYFRIRNSELDV